MIFCGLKIKGVQPSVYIHSKSRRPTWPVMVPLLFVFLVGTESVSYSQRKARGSSSNNDSLEAAKPQLLNPDTNPVLRFSIVDYPTPGMGWMLNPFAFSVPHCFGWLDISRDSVQYRVV